MNKEQLREVKGFARSLRWYLSRVGQGRACVHWVPHSLEEMFSFDKMDQNENIGLPEAGGTLKGGGRCGKRSGSPQH